MSYEDMTKKEILEDLTILDTNLRELVARWSEEMKTYPNCGCGQYAKACLNLCIKELLVVLGEGDS